ncbi:MAG: arylsulfatase [Candidatus Hydrogenedentes bacterium]|nr:arylsulfatase [Candidatus Hydrogenedentota bacterium]
MSSTSRPRGVSRRAFIQAGAFGAGAATLAQSPATAAPRAHTARPNILFLMSDQHRGDCVGADGNAAIHTPNMDRLAREGALFRCAYSTTPTCTPARAALLTGMNPWNHGMLGYSKVPEQYPVEMPRVLRDAGYHTLAVGKMHWSPQRGGHGFHNLILDEASREDSPEFRSDYRAWFASEAPNLEVRATGISSNSYRAAPYALPEALHPTHWTGEVARRFIETYERPEPFFLKVSFVRPHSPWDPPKRWMDFYQDKKLPAAHVGKWAERYRPRSDDSENIWHGDLGADQVRHSRQGYYGSVSHVDEEIGRVLEALEARGMLENTLILYTSDHGDMTGDHHLWRKSYAYEASARIPMIVRWPEGMVDAPRGQTLRVPVEIRDILPTFAEAAGAAIEHPIDGRSLIDAIRGADDWRPWIDLEHDICYGERNHWSGLTDGRIKYIFHAFDGEEQLFDLEKDPGEIHDLAGDPAHADTLHTWRERLIAHLEHRGEEWVKDGKLALRPQSILKSPNYPV